MSHPAAQTFGLGIPAGFLVAAMVWTTRVEGERFWMVLGLTWLISAGELAHVVAGPAEVFLIVFDEGWRQLSLLFAMLAYAQVRDELPE